MKPILERLQQSFGQHSADGRRRYSNTRLREQAVKCLDHCTHKEISEAIGVKIHAVRMWQKTIRHRKEPFVSTPAFLPMMLDSRCDSHQSNQAPLVLKLTLPRGIRVKVELGDLESAAVFITTLSQENNPCSI